MGEDRDSRGRQEDRMLEELRKLSHTGQKTRLEDMQRLTQKLIMPELVRKKLLEAAAKGNKEISIRFEEFDLTDDTGREYSYKIYEPAVIRFLESQGFGVRVQSSLRYGDYLHLTW